MVSDTNPPSARNKALDILSRREHSVAELRTKLKVREFEPEAIEAAIDALLQEDLVSDERFAEAFIVSRVRKGQGPIRIRGELRQRGVADVLIDRHLEQAGVDWICLARTVRERKYGSAGSIEYRERARQSRFLQHRGFSAEQVRSAFVHEHADDEYRVVEEI